MSRHDSPNANNSRNNQGKYAMSIDWAFKSRILSDAHHSWTIALNHFSLQPLEVSMILLNPHRVVSFMATMLDAFFLIKVQQHHRLTATTRQSQTTKVTPSCPPPFKPRSKNKNPWFIWTDPKFIPVRNVEHILRVTMILLARVFMEGMVSYFILLHWGLYCISVTSHSHIFLITSLHSSSKSQEEHTYSINVSTSH